MAMENVQFVADLPIENCDVINNCWDINRDFAVYFTRNMTGYMAPNSY